MSFFFFSVRGLLFTKDGNYYLNIFFKKSKISLSSILDILRNNESILKDTFIKINIKNWGFIRYNRFKETIVETKENLAKNFLKN